jgi:hypothetical protein
MWSTAAIGRYLLLDDSDVGSGRYSNPPRIPVHIGDSNDIVYLYAEDLRCSRCDEYITPPDTRPAAYLAIRKTVFDGLCGACADAADETYDSTDDTDASIVTGVGDD